MIPRFCVPFPTLGEDTQNGQIITTSQSDLCNTMSILFHISQKCPPQHISHKTRELLIRLICNIIAQYQSFVA